MAISVTGVTSFGKPPVDYSRWPEAAPRGDHVHRALEALALNQIETSVCQKAEAEGDENAWEAGPEAWCRFMHEQGTTSPEGIDCSKWIEKLMTGQISPNVSMSDFWDQMQTIACEHTLVHRRKSLGGQLDLLCLYNDRVILVDLKTKSANWKGASKDDIDSYKAQAGGYLYLLSDGDDAHGGCLVDECMTLIVTPNTVKWLPPYDPDDCYEAWETCWDKYSASAALNPF
jgi:ATP-dependent exoDNAse (exonuclease V) beta subunit